MKIIPRLLMYANLFSCFAAVLLVLKDIIHNKDAFILINAFILCLAFFNLDFFIRLYKDIENESE